VIENVFIEVVVRVARAVPVNPSSSFLTKM